MTREAAARFSFLLATPLIAGAAAKEVPKLIKAPSRRRPRFPAVHIDRQRRRFGHRRLHCHRFLPAVFADTHIEDLYLLPYRVWYSRFVARVPPPGFCAIAPAHPGFSTRRAFPYLCPVVAVQPEDASQRYLRDLSPPRHALCRIIRLEVSDVAPMGKKGKSRAHPDANRKQTPQRADRLRRPQPRRSARAQLALLFAARCFVQRFRAASRRGPRAQLDRPGRRAHGRPFLPILRFRAFLFPMGMFLVAMRWFRSQMLEAPIAKVVGFTMLLASFSSGLALLHNAGSPRRSARRAACSERSWRKALRAAFNPIGADSFPCATFLTALFLTTSFSFRTALAWMKKPMANDGIVGNWARVQGMARRPRIGAPAQARGRNQNCRTPASAADSAFRRRNC